MSNVYVISDLHLSHDKLVKRREFNSIEEHDNHIIESWNSIVQKNDTVWILGDITMETSKPYYLLNKLYGTKNVILGNHDKPKHIPELLKYVNKVAGCMKIKNSIFTHIPVHSIEFEKFKYNVHGHLHTLKLDNPRYINVCCENLHYKPTLLYDLIK